MGSNSLTFWIIYHFLKGRNAGLTETLGCHWRITNCMSQTPNDKIYFGGLNGLRFFAATAVIFHHIEQYKLWASVNGTYYASAFTGDGLLSTIIQAFGHKAVSFFFVLSGFLITYLLLAETTKTGTVDRKSVV